MHPQEEKEKCGTTNYQDKRQHGDRICWPKIPAVIKWLFGEI